MTLIPELTVITPYFYQLDIKFVIKNSLMHNNVACDFKNTEFPII